MPFTQPWFEVDFGDAYGGIGTTGYRLYRATGADSVARTTTGVVDLGNGGYGVPAVSVPDNAVGIEWDTGGGSPVYAREDTEPYRDRMNLDAAVSSRAAPGNAMDLVTDALDADALATSALAELNTYLETTAGHGSGAWTGTTPAAVAAAVWSEALPGTFGAGEAGKIIGDNVDALISSRAVAGDAMDLITDALDSASLATSALSELNLYLETTGGHGAGAWTGTTPSAVATAVWGEALPGAFGAGTAGYILGTNLDALISDVVASIAALNDIDQAGVQAALTAQGYTSGRAPNLDYLDAAITSRAVAGDAMALTSTTLDAVADVVWDELIADHLGGDKAGQHLEDADATADPAAVAVAVWSQSLPGAFGAGEAGYILGTYLDGPVSDIPGNTWEALAADHVTPDTMGFLMNTRSVGSPFDPAGLTP